MGLYDHVETGTGILPLSKKLPKAEKDYFKSEDWLSGWQTKNLYCAMRSYVLNKKGLFEQHYKEVKKPLKQYKEESQSWENENPKTTFHYLWKPRKTMRVKDRLIKVNHHGIIEICDIKQFGKDEYFTEYEIKFTDGIITRIKLLQCRKLQKNKKVVDNLGKKTE